MIVTTVLLWILAGLLAVLLLAFLLLLPSLRIYFTAQAGKINVVARYLFLSYHLYPAKQKPAKQKKKADDKPQAEEAPPPEEEKKPSLREKITQYKPLMRRGKKILRTLFKRVIIYKVKARVSVCGDDAHKTALNYAKVTSMAAIFVQILGWAFTLQKTDIVINPDFLGERSAYAVSFRARVRPIFALIAAMRLIPAYLEASKRHRKTRKGGKKYESAASHQ